MTNNEQEVMEVLTGPERRRRWSAEEKQAMVKESFKLDKSVLIVLASTASSVAAVPSPQRAAKIANLVPIRI